MAETSRQPFAGALEAIHRILNREPEADEVLRQVVCAVQDRIGHYAWTGLLFVEGDELRLGPRKGEQGAVGVTLEVPIAYEGRRIGALRVISPTALGDEDRAFLERVAVLVSLHCLVGWDTGGVPWSDVA
jgi:putative methionine-R-sulfoxide reductase with GAF domain